MPGYMQGPFGGMLGMFGYNIGNLLGGVSSLFGSTFGSGGSFLRQTYHLTPVRA